MAGLTLRSLARLPDLFAECDGCPELTSVEDMRMYSAENDSIQGWLCPACAEMAGVSPERGYGTLAEAIVKVARA